jgi:hypothetical protein
MTASPDLSAARLRYVTVQDEPGPWGGTIETRMPDADPICPTCSSPYRAGHRGAMVGSTVTRRCRDPWHGDDTQPMPTVRRGAGDIQSLVVEDIVARREVGVTRYGTALQANNGRDGLRDALDESYDLACYLRQVVEEQVQIDRMYASLVEHGGSVRVYPARGQSVPAHWVAHYRRRGKDPITTYEDYDAYAYGDTPREALLHLAYGPDWQIGL